ncbi:hypothetical protein BD410DRAFT_369386 [Rickenella mellea]|uniref:Uncharacterized protein n=1 Tax=Rickenella mellea TaxID=50990 RepID=A0A4Y7PYB6_9AGAM|nr:hypothetical protein BD410DRAFT_369386 [Rickenella mellea]
MDDVRWRFTPLLPRVRFAPESTANPFFPLRTSEHSYPTSISLHASSFHPPLWHPCRHRCLRSYRAAPAHGYQHMLTSEPRCTRMLTELDSKKPSQQEFRATLPTHFALLSPKFLANDKPVLRNKDVEGFIAHGCSNLPIGLFGCLTAWPMSTPL